jgi:hypothetical protein
MQRRFVNIPLDDRVNSLHGFTSENLMKTLIALVAGTGPLLATGVAWAQDRNMMNGSGWGMGSMDGYGGIWGPVLLVVAIVAVVALAMQRKRK